MARPGFERPVDRILEALRQRWSDAHRADPDHLGVWHGTCPACGFIPGCCSLRIAECCEGGPVSLTCSRGCSEEAILAALASGPLDPQSIAAVALEVLELRRRMRAYEEALSGRHRVSGGALEAAA